MMPCLPNSVCHQVHRNTITCLLRNKMKIANHLILIASDVHHIVIFTGFLRLPS